MPIRVLTWNLWWRFGPWEQRARAIEQSLVSANADVICLQEVWASDGGVDQVEELANALGFSYGRTPSAYWQGYSFGNAILSRWPILEIENHALPGKSGGPGHRSFRYDILHRAATSGVTEKTRSSRLTLPCLSFTETTSVPERSELIVRIPETRR